MGGGGGGGGPGSGGRIRSKRRKMPILFIKSVSHTDNQTRGKREGRSVFSEEKSG